MGLLFLRGQLSGLTVDKGCGGMEPFKGDTMENRIVGLVCLLQLAAVFMFFVTVQGVLGGCAPVPVYEAPPCEDVRCVLQRELVTI